jgi:hypothetical protein
MVLILANPAHAAKKVSLDRAMTVLKTWTAVSEPPSLSECLRLIVAFARRP